MSKNYYREKQSQNYSSKQYTSKQLEKEPVLPRKTLTTKVPVIIGEEFMNKVRWLCQKVPKDEWSGILFYSIEGSIENLSTFKCIMEDILPLDVGTKTGTHYDFDNRYIDYMQKDEKRFDWMMGHIHSHNDMNSYFSGVDMAELNDNCPNYPYYLSLIVNNREELVAKIAMKVSTQGYVLECTNERSKVYERSIVDKQDMMLLIDCTIEKPKLEFKVDEEFVANFNLIEEYEKKAKKEAQQKMKIQNKMVVSSPYKQQVQSAFNDDFLADLDLTYVDFGEEHESQQLEAVVDNLTCHIFSFGQGDKFPSMNAVFDEFVAAYKRNPITRTQLLNHFDSLFSSYFEGSLTPTSILGNQAFEGVLENIALYSDYDEKLFNSIIIELEKKYEN